MPDYDMLRVAMKSGRVAAVSKLIQDALDTAERLIRCEGRD
jgi:hypothetical protein